MKNSKKTLSEQLTSVKESLITSTTNSKIAKKRISIDPGIALKTTKIKSKQECKEQTSDFLLLTYSKIEQAILYREELWNSSLTSSKEYLCDQCNKFHLRDIHGIPLASKQKFFERPDLLKNNNIRKERERCSLCKSSELYPKAIFNDLLDAKSSLNNLSIAIKYEMYAYFCPHGNGIHLTKSLPKRAGQYVAALKQSVYSKSTASIQKQDVSEKTPAAPKIHKKKKIQCVPKSGKFHCSECDYQLIYFDRLKGCCPRCNGEFYPITSL
jgi:hypothetical protein